jgi:putative peptidoglycan lipid II flippase
VAAAVGLFFVGEFAIRLLLGGGAFDEADVTRTSVVLAAFAVSVPFDALSHPLSRAIYATRNTILPVLASVAALAVTVAGALFLAPRIGITSIPLAFAAGAAVKVVVLGIAIIPRIRTIAPET